MTGGRGVHLAAAFPTLIRLLVPRNSDGCA